MLNISGHVGGVRLVGDSVKQTARLSQLLTSDLGKATYSPSLGFLLCKMEQILVTAS